MLDFYFISLIVDQIITKFPEVICRYLTKVSSKSRVFFSSFQHFCDISQRLKQENNLAYIKIVSLTSSSESESSYKSFIFCRGIKTVAGIRSLPPSIIHRKRSLFRGQVVLFFPNIVVQPFFIFLPNSPLGFKLFSSAAEISQISFIFYYSSVWSVLLAR